MLLTPAPERRSHEIVGRKPSAFKRRKRREREGLPHLAAHVAERVPADQAMTRRPGKWDEVAVYVRQAKAAAWRDVRERYYALPPHIRAVLKIQWERFGGTRSAAELSSLIMQVAGELGASAEDFPGLGLAARRAMTATINDRARRDDPATRPTRAYSPDVGAWLRQAPSGRFASLWSAIAAFDAFGPGVDPTAERRTGVVHVDGKWLRFDILALRPGKEVPSPTPWNVDLSRRVIWVTFQDELLDYFGAGEVFR